LWLEHYVQEFPAVEVDATFYRLPERSVFESWASRTPERFRFVIKASRFLTHVKRLREPEEPVRRLMERVEGLGPKCAMILLQLPPDMRISLDALDETLSCFGTGARVAVEPRHESWWTDDVAGLLRKHNAATVWSDRRSKLFAPMWHTSDFGYLRLHEGRASPWPRYGRRALESWGKRLAVGASHWDEAYVFFNNDPGGAAVADAQVLRRLLSHRPSD